MIVNPDKFKSIVIQKRNQTNKSKQFLIGNNVAEVTSSVKRVKLLGIHIDDQLSFNLHISSIYQKQSSKGVPRKRCSENMQQIYRRTLIPKCHFNKVALHISSTYKSASKQLPSRQFHVQI